jgi:uncharacterized protein
MDVAQHDFRQEILEITAHRPWPMPDEPWIMTQTWNDLLFAHWQVDAAELRALVPSQLELELFNGNAWLGIVPFHMTNVAPRFVPAMPWLSAFPELNVRTYVIVAGRPGVYFFSLDAANPLAVQAARTLFHLPYFTAEMTVSELADGTIAYQSRRTGRGAANAQFAARYRPVGAVRTPEPASVEEFLTERYCLYTLDNRSRICIVEIHHPPWRLQPAEAEFSLNTMSAAAGIGLPDSPPLLHFVKRQDTVAWPIHVIRPA